MSIPRNLEAMKKAMRLYEQLVAEAPIKQEEFPAIFALFKILEKYDVPIPKNVREMLFSLENGWQTYLKRLMEAEEMLGNIKEEFKQTLLKQADRFKHIIKNLYDEFALKVPTTSKT